MRIAFFVDAGAEIGTGHLFRCLTLANYCIELGHPVAFYLYSDNIVFSNQIKKRGFDVFIHKVRFEKLGVKVVKYDEFNEKTSQKMLLEFIQTFAPTICLADSYFLDKNWSQFVKRYVKKAGFLDDLGDRKLCGDFLIDQNLDACWEKYNGLIHEHTVTMFGTEYAIVASEFSKLRSASIDRKLAGKIDSLFINFGGSDPENFTEKTLKSIIKFDELRGLKLTIVCGAAYRFQKGLISFLRYSDLNYECIWNSNNMAELMAENSMAIGGGGTTALERCCMGLPTLQFIMAENQRQGTYALSEANAVKLVSNFDTVNRLYSDINRSEYKNMVLSASQLVDGNGGYRVIKKLRDIVDS